MRILICHNRYQNRGGEDAVVEAESRMLREHGHAVMVYERTNEEIDSFSAIKKFQYAFEMVWSRRTYQELKEIIQEFKPDIAHFHNIFFMITPSAYTACRESGVPIVQSQHNFRLQCSNALFFRDNHVCEDCVTKSLWQGVIHRCYKKSFLMTALAVRMIDHHWKKGTWIKMVDTYIVASEFGRQKIIPAGIPAEKIVIKPNFVHQEASPMDKKDQGYALYVGRLSQEKGVDVILKTWMSLPDLPLKIMGAGPLENELKDFVKNKKLSHVEFLGYVDKPNYIKNMLGAKFLILPSVCYENFPRIIAEAFSFGIPVVASRLGSLAELVKEGETGVLFTAGDPEDCLQKIKNLLNNGDQLKVMGQNAFKEFSQKYSAERNYFFLNDIYTRLLDRKE